MNPTCRVPCSAVVYQRCKAASSASRPTRSPGAGHAGAGGSTGAGHQTWGQRGVRHRHVGDEPQPVAVHGLNHPLRAPTVTHRPAHRLDAGGQGLLPHVLVGPHLGQHFVTADHPVALLEEIHQHLKDFAPQRDAHATPAQLIALRVKRTVAKDILHGRCSSLTPGASYTPDPSHRPCRDLLALAVPLSPPPT